MSAIQKAVAIFAIVPGRGVTWLKTRNRATALGRAMAAGLLGIMVIVAPGVVRAHGVAASSGDAVGLEIPAITHSDMEFVSRHHSAIIALAEQQTETDERLRRLLNYSQIQYAYCLWGLVPGSISNEDSAFNPCSHAYLAATWALLQHLETKPAAQASAAMIRQSIEADRAANPLLVMCQNSAETFHTGSFIVPVKPAVAGGWLSILVVAGGLAMAGVRRLTARSWNGPLTP